MISAETIRRATLWILLAVSAFDAFEPSPSEFMFAALIIVFAGRGLRFDRTMAPLILTMAIYNGAGLIALAPYVDESASVAFTFTTAYVTLTMVIFAAIVADRPLEQLATIRSGYVFAAIVAATLGILGYFDVAGLGPLFSVYDNTRAAGPFKDPNVFGPFLAAPILWLAQDLLMKRGAAATALAKLAPLLIGLGLSFSRGAILDAALGLVMLFALTFATSPSAAGRQRVVIGALGAVAIVLILALVALTIPSVREIAMARATLSQDYDVGAEGRFGSQIRAIPLLLDRPLGFGPLRFARFFPQDPHETFLSTFASYGWAGGLGFAAFTAITIYVGWKVAFSRSKFGPEAIVLWSASFPQILQGVQIDTEHWRHLYLISGCIFGLAAAERAFRPAPREASRGDPLRLEPRPAPL